MRLKLERRIFFLNKIYCIIFGKTAQGKLNDVVFLYKWNLDWHVKTPEFDIQLTTYNKLDLDSIKHLQNILNGIKP
jgi:hypothetical protein